ncbi:glycosyltransferase family 2 protein [Actinotalea solisilvae]|uniref:glycosyltransferase family 2 protein n=1 Tax=Actinotalea solisilvae TaxID=2072922 RepID=UPI0018F14D4B|nr:glycosyltransferase family 2 protein [Actinotalea solisilvae]
MTSTRQRATISAVLIVKDEEAVLERCLASVAWADEIVVYDTGSTDRTREIARRFTENVVEGYWDADFGAARNRAIRHASGQWILVLDADEVFHGSPEIVRARLGHDGAQRHTILVENASPIALGPTSTEPSVRFFRRDVYHYRGKLHEQVVPRPGAVVTGPTLALPHARLVHHGYSVAVFEEKGKSERNLAIAERDLAAAVRAGAPARQQALLRANLLRSLVPAGRGDEALAGARELVDEGLLEAPSTSTLARLMSIVAHTYRDAEAFQFWTQTWADSDPTPAWAWAYRAQCAGERGNAEAALEALDRMPTVVVDAAQRTLDRRQLAAVEVWALHRTGRRRHALRVARDAAAAGFVPATPEVLTALCADRPEELRALLASMSAAAWDSFALLCTRTASDLGLDLLAVMLEARPGHVTVLTCAAAMASVMSIEDAMRWSLEVRNANLPQLCPLVAIAQTVDLDPRQRAVAAAITIEAYGQQSVLPWLEDALARVPGEHEAELLRLLDEVAPGLVQPTVPA